MVGSHLEEAVKLTITLPENVARKVCRLPDPDEFISRAVERALEQSAAPAERSEEGSRWARLAHEVEDGSMSLGEAAAGFDRDRREFREGFRFKHDESE
jgi:hypothetical protein